LDIFNLRAQGFGVTTPHAVDSTQAMLGLTASPTAVLAPWLAASLDFGLGVPLERRTYTLVGQTLFETRTIGGRASVSVELRF
jgi:hypothetical protein